MAMKTAFVVQPFELHRKRLRPAQQEPASSESGALKKTENLAKRMPGAAALKAVADDETGELEGVTILGQWGEIPDDFAESLLCGWGLPIPTASDQTAARSRRERLTGSRDELREGERRSRSLRFGREGPVRFHHCHLGCVEEHPGPQVATGRAYLEMHGRLVGRDTPAP
jgi:hypothetical protein